KIPADLSKLPGPIVGFFGLIADWVDLKLIRALALARPNYSFVLIGKVDTDTEMIDGVPNVHLIGKREYTALPMYCRGFDVAILPFVVNKLTLAANPLKLREYLAAGLPIVSTAIPEAERLKHAVRIAKDPEDFLKQLDESLDQSSFAARLEISRTVDHE